MVIHRDHTGNVTLKDFTVTDDLAGLSTIVWDDTSKLDGLAPGEPICGVATSPITQADVEAGKAESTVESSGTPNGSSAEGSDSAEVELASDPAISIEKSGGVGRGPECQPGR